jgi:5-formyltetrahydrofolate cyclo-ligase
MADQEEEAPGGNSLPASPFPQLGENDIAPLAAEPDLDKVWSWRTAERKRLIDERKSLPFVQREDFTRKIAVHLDQVIGNPAGKKISVYWPYLAEPDLRGWMGSVASLGAECLLPVVVAKGHPLVFRSWRMGEPLERGAWNIPVPAGGREMVPDIVIAPLVGYDEDCFRLGYGGAFFDRTLANLNCKPQAIGVGFELQKIETIIPLPHDIAMNAVVTETGVRFR